MTNSEDDCHQSYNDFSSKIERKNKYESLLPPKTIISTRSYHQKSRKKYQPSSHERLRMDR